MGTSNHVAMSVYIVAVNGASKFLKKIVAIGAAKLA
jgi:hypothetical protein